MEKCPTILRVRNCLSEELRKPIYRGNPNPMVGHCYVASEAMYYLLGGKEAGLTPMVLKTSHGTHWFLKTSTGKIVDPTSDQFSEKPSYELGRPCGFLTKQPCKRTQIVLNRIKELS